MTKFWVRLMVLSFSLLVLLGGTVSAADYKNLISVEGRVTKEYAPDRAVIRVSVVTSGDTAEAARVRNTEIVSRVMHSLSVYGISRQDIKTVDYNLHPRFVNDGKGKRKQKGYELTHSLSVTVDEIKKIGAVIDQMYTDGVASFQNVTFSLSNREEIERSLLAAAVENARAKAAMVANAGGRVLGPLCYASIGRVGGMSFSNSNRDLLMAKSGMNGGVPTELSGGVLKVSVSVDAEFQLL